MPNPLDPSEDQPSGWRPWLMMGVRWCWLIIVLFAVICLVSAKNVGQESSGEDTPSSRRVANY